MSESLGALGSVSRRYQEQAAAFEPVAVAAAEAEAAHKSARARRTLQALADGANSHAKAETVAEADPEIAVLYRQRLITAAKAEAAREHLRSLREAVATGRTFAASEREIDKLHAEGRG